MKKTLIRRLCLEGRLYRPNKFLERSSMFGGLVAVAIVLSGCASTESPQSVVNAGSGTAIATATAPKSAAVPAPASVSQKPAATTGSLTKPAMETQVMGAVTSPLSDFNLIRAEISPELNAAMKGPYLMPVDKSCEGIGAEVSALDRIIGPDLDALSANKIAGLFEQGQSELSNAAIGALRSTVEGVIPFRSWIRRFSGADRHSKDVTAALAAGVVRRAFLKGLGQASGCVAPAAPLPPAEPETPVASAGSAATPVVSGGPVMPATKND
jgi:hypothetical protein